MDNSNLDKAQLRQVAVHEVNRGTKDEDAHEITREETGWPEEEEFETEGEALAFCLRALRSSWIG
jgi:hypothetical protein